MEIFEFLNQGDKLESFIAAPSGSNMVAVMIEPIENGRYDIESAPVLGWYVVSHANGAIKGGPRFSTENPVWPMVDGSLACMNSCSYFVAVVHADVFRELKEYDPRTRDLSGPVKRLQELVEIRVERDRADVLRQAV